MIYYVNAKQRTRSSVRCFVLSGELAAPLPHELGGVKAGLSASVFPKAPAGDGVDRSKYIFESEVTPKSLLDPVSCTLLKASRNMAL